MRSALFTLLTSLWLVAPVLADGGHDHHPLQKREAQHGMGNYLLYMTPGACPATAPTPLASQ